MAPDTSPRGLDLPGEHKASDFGSGAGFYVDAIREPWALHYRMYTYLTEELPALVADAFPVEADRCGTPVAAAAQTVMQARAASASSRVAAHRILPWATVAGVPDQSSTQPPAPRTTGIKAATS